MNGQFEQVVAQVEEAFRYGGDYRESEVLQEVLRGYRVE